MLIAEFGSRHNGKRQLNSDRDLLIVGSNWQEISSAKKQYLSRGYSISCFKNDKAEYLSRHGSLFFKHIIDECVVLSDKDNLKDNISSLWSPRNNYQEEIESNLDLLELFKSTPNNKYSHNFINDLLIISIRNILIRRLAEQGEYVFGWENIFIKAIKHGLITNNDACYLKISRQLKNAYRESLFYAIDNSFIATLLEISSKVFKVKIKLGKENKKEILGFPDYYKDGTYMQLRALELMCSYYSFDKSLASYIELVKNPSYSCSTNALTNKDRL